MLGALRRGGGQGPTGPAQLPAQGFHAGETDPERSCGLPQVTQRGRGQGSTLACLSRIYPPPGVLMQGGLPVLPTMLHGVLGESLPSLGLSFPFYALKALTPQRF